MILYTLPKRFKKIERRYIFNTINQHNGISYRGKNPFKLVLETMCGKCVGAHLADIYQTDIDEDGDRYYQYGIKALHEELEQLPHFQSWRHSNYPGHSHYLIVSEYLYKTAGAPVQCFGAGKWRIFKDGKWVKVYPSDVFQKVIDNNQLKQAA